MRTHVQFASTTRILLWRDTHPSLLAPQAQTRVTHLHPDFREVSESHAIHNEFLPCHAIVSRPRQEHLASNMPLASAQVENLTPSGIVHGESHKGVPDEVLDVFAPNNNKCKMRCVGLKTTLTRQSILTDELGTILSHASRTERPPRMNVRHTPSHQHCMCLF